MKYVLITLFVILALIITLGLFIIIKTILIRNKKQQLLQLQDEKQRNDRYAIELFELIKIKTTNSDSYHLIREKLKQLFPLVHQHFIREKIEENVYYTYDTNDPKLPHILLVTHMDTTLENETAYLTSQEIYGNGTFDSKAYLYTAFKAAEEILANKKKLNVNLVLVVTVDDETTKTGNEKIVNSFLKKGRFFNLVLEEGTGIIDPTSFGLQSNHALIGIGVTGEMTVRYQISKEKGMIPLQHFMNDLITKNIFKSEIDKNTGKVLSTFAKDLKFKQRMMFSNPHLFKPFIKKYLDSETVQIGKLLKTQVKFSEIQENEKYFYTIATFNLASHDTPAEIIRTVVDYLQKYELEYHVEKITEPSKITLTTSKGYRVVKKAILDVFKNIYIAPYIVTKYSERRYFTKVSDCVIRFSPLYYEHQAIKDAYNGNQHIKKKSLSYGVDFFKKIIDGEN